MTLPSPYLDQIKKFEGFTPRASWDYKQHSNGYGTRAKFPGETIDKDEAERRFQGEIGNAHGIVSKFAPSAPEGVRAALTSLTYNAGDGWTKSGLGQAVQAGDWSKAKQHFVQYNKAGGETLPGLVSRRNSEASWFDGQPMAAGDNPAASNGSPKMALGIAAPYQPNQGGNSPAPGTDLSAVVDPEYAKYLSAIMPQKSAAPRNIGEGLNYIGEKFNEAGWRNQLLGAINQSAAGKQQAMQTYLTPTGTVGTRPNPNQPAGIAAPRPEQAQAAPQQPAGAVQPPPATQLPANATAVLPPSESRPGIMQGPMPLGTLAPRTAGADGQPQQAAGAQQTAQPGYTSVPRAQSDPFADRRAAIQAEKVKLSALAAHPANHQFVMSKIQALDAEEASLNDPVKLAQVRNLDLESKAKEQAIQRESNEFKPIGTDMLGNPRYGFVNPVTRSVVPVDQAGSGGSGGMTLSPEAEHALRNGGVNGQEFLKLLPPAIADEIKGYAEGRLPYNPAMNMKPRGQAMTSLIQAYDPNFDAVNYAARNSTRKDFTSGPSAKNVTSFNTAIGHMQHLLDAHDALNNWNAPLGSLVRTVTNPIAAKVSPDAEARLRAHDTARMAVAEELARAFKGISPTHSEADYWKSVFDPTNSPAAARSSVKEASKLLKSRIDALGEQYNRGMGTTKDPMELLTPEARAGWSKLSGEKQDGSADHAAKAAPKARPQGTNDQQLIDDANKAITNGADRNAVMQRLKGWGINVTAGQQ